MGGGLSAIEGLGILEDEGRYQPRLPEGLQMGNDLLVEGATIPGPFLARIPGYKGNLCAGLNPFGVRSLYHLTSETFPCVSHDICVTTCLS
jgi:hypothetical protein